VDRPSAQSPEGTAELDTTETQVHS
jgi:hypothetical protein